MQAPARNKAEKVTKTGKTTQKKLLIVVKTTMERLLLLATEARLMKTMMVFFSIFVSVFLEAEKRSA